MFKKARRDVYALLMLGEQILFVTDQTCCRSDDYEFVPESLYITNRRVLFKNRISSGSEDYVKIDYEDISNIRLEQGSYSPEIILEAKFLIGEIKISVIDKKEAEKINIMICEGIEGQLPGQNLCRKMTEIIVKAF
jgi:hypothetical protein